MLSYRYNERLVAALLLRDGPAPDEEDGDSDPAHRDDHLFSSSNVTFAAVATPENVKSQFDNTVGRTPLFPFANTQQVRRLSLPVAVRAVEVSTYNPLSFAGNVRFLSERRGSTSKN